MGGLGSEEGLVSKETVTADALKSCITLRTLLKYIGGMASMPSYG